MKLLILGHGRHGKDTVATMLQNLTGMSFKSSSEAANELAVFPYLSEIYGYETLAECFADRANHREEWRHLITEYNTPDKGKLCREILADVDCYVGMRCPLEYVATWDLFGAVLWVDASKRLPPDPSMSIEQEWLMHVVDNNGTLAQLELEVARVARTLGLIA